MLKTNRHALKPAGMRVTSQRELIMDIIRQGHLDADEIFSRARQKEPRISLSTVYRTLQKFKELGLVDELYLDDTHHHYEAKAPAEHHHLVCQDCGKVVEFQYPLSRYLKRNIAEARGFDITETQIRITGYCTECRRSKHNISKKTGKA